MRILDNGKYLRVLPQNETLNTDMLLGWRQAKNDPWYTVENNIVNRIVLGVNPVVKISHSLDNIVEIVEATTGLKDYQIADVKKMCSLRHFLNANPMGLGKTIEAIRYLNHIGGKNVLIVTPKIIRWQWVAQLKKWWGPEAQVYEGQRVVTGGIWIVNYDKLRTEATLNKFKRFQWDVVILDEAHKIKSRKSKQTVAVKSIPAARRVALTGTPILRYVDDLWSILNFLDESYSGISYWNFVDYFCETEDTPWGNKIVGMTLNPAKIKVLNQLMQLVSIRNNAIEVAHGKVTEVVRLPMTKKQRELYRKEKALLLDELPEGCTISNGAVLTLRLRQTTSWPGLYIENEPGPKFEWILETCFNNPNEKFVVLSTFEKTISALCKYLDSNGVSAVSITGKNDEKTNEVHKKLFMEHNTQVLAGTIGAMGQGYDGLQDVCRLMVVIDRDWSPEIMAQAEERLHRMGQNDLVNIYYLECQGSFDQHVGRINQHKADDIREALKNEQ